MEAQRHKGIETNEICIHNDFQIFDLYSIWEQLARVNEICIHNRLLKERRRDTAGRSFCFLVCIGLTVWAGCGGEGRERPTGAPIRFLDVAAESGIRMRGVSEGREKKYILEIKGGGEGA